MIDSPEFRLTTAIQAHYSRGYVAIDYHYHHLSSDALRYILEQIGNGEGVIYGPRFDHNNVDLIGFGAFSPEDTRYNGAHGINWRDVEMQARLALGRGFLHDPSI